MDEVSLMSAFEHSYVKEGRNGPLVDGSASKQLILSRKLTKKV